MLLMLHSGANSNYNREDTRWVGEYEDAVSRAYYAMYQAAKAVLSSINVFPKLMRGWSQKSGRRLVLTGFFSKELGGALAEAKATKETYEYGIPSVIKRPERCYHTGQASSWAAKTKVIP
ncbi:MAG: hypothetical protein AOA65_0501 [Candidatus Bathyarchaeota archaeon BA1]|nr:MAG: hypothetical protein AOA65_0501 [Candidatus Bathyarchaeota archaeon BA1]